MCGVGEMRIRFVGIVVGCCVCESGDVCCFFVGEVEGVLVGVFIDDECIEVFEG